jgi:hypothetical protein
MTYFIIISAVSATALFLVQRMDIECVNPPKPRKAAKPRETRVPLGSPAVR